MTTSSSPEPTSPASPDDRSAAAAAPHSLAPAIRARGLTDGYGRTGVLDDIDLHVPAGGLFSLLGRNGAGKSTLVQSLLGFRRPNTGDLTVLGREPWIERRRLMRDVALVPETPNVPPHMTIRGAARFVATFLPSGRFDHAAFSALLDEDGLRPRARFGSLSRGQKSSVGLALALAARPRLMILDDPALGLDAVARRRTYRRLIDEQAGHGTTIFLTTHDLAAVDGLATHVGFLHGGQLPVVGAVNELRQRFRLVELDPADDIHALPGRLVRLDRGSLRQRALIEVDEESATETDERLTVTTPTMEDLFIALLEDDDDRVPRTTHRAA